MTRVSPVPSVFHQMSWERPDDDQLFHRIQRSVRPKKRSKGSHITQLCEEAARSSIALTINNELEDIIYWYDA
jgi:hypothetical protein